jgi:hypothetical protein
MCDYTGTYQCTTSCAPAPPMPVPYPAYCSPGTPCMPGSGCGGSDVNGCYSFCSCTYGYYTCSSSCQGAVDASWE